MMLMRVNTHREFGITYTPNLQHEPCLAALLRDSNWVNIRFWFHTPLWICHPQHKTKSLNKSDRRHTTEVAEQAQTQYLRSCLCKPLGSSPTTDDDDDESHPLPSLPEIWIPTKLHKTLFNAPPIPRTKTFNRGPHSWHSYSLQLRHVLQKTSSNSSGSSIEDKNNT